MPRIVAGRQDAVKAVLDKLEADPEVLSELKCSTGDPRLEWLAVDLVTAADELTPARARSEILRQAVGASRGADIAPDHALPMPERLKRADAIRQRADAVLDEADRQAGWLYVQAAWLAKGNLDLLIKPHESNAKKAPPTTSAHGPDELYAALDVARQLNVMIATLVPTSKQRALTKSLATLIGRVIEHGVARSGARTPKGRNSEVLRLLRERRQPDGTVSTPIQQLFPHLDSPTRSRVAVCTIAIALGVMKKPTQNAARQKTRDELYDDRVANLLRRRATAGKS